MLVNGTWARDVDAQCWAKSVSVVGDLSYDTSSYCCFRHLPIGGQGNQSSEYMWCQVHASRDVR